MESFPRQKIPPTRREFVQRNLLRQLENRSPTSTALPRHPPRIWYKTSPAHLPTRPIHHGALPPRPKRRPRRLPVRKPHDILREPLRGLPLRRRQELGVVLEQERDVEDVGGVALPFAVPGVRLVEVVQVGGARPALREARRRGEEADVAREGEDGAQREGVGQRGDDVVGAEQRRGGAGRAVREGAGDGGAEGLRDAGFAGCEQRGEYRGLWWKRVSGWSPGKRQRGGWLLTSNWQSPTIRSLHQWRPGSGRNGSSSLLEICGKVAAPRMTSLSMTGISGVDGGIFWRRSATGVSRSALTRSALERFSKPRVLTTDVYADSETGRGSALSISELPDMLMNLSNSGSVECKRCIPETGGGWLVDCGLLRRCGEEKSTRACTFSDQCHIV